MSMRMSECVGVKVSDTEGEGVCVFVCVCVCVCERERERGRLELCVGEHCLLKYGLCLSLR